MNRFMGLVVKATAILLSAAAVAAHAQYPNRPLKIIVPFSAGGSTDVLARTIAQHLEPRLKQPVIVENKPGGGTIIGANLVAKSSPDAHTILLGSDITFAINPHTMKEMPIDPLKDLAPVMVVGIAPNWIVMRADSKERDLKAFVERARGQPGTISMSVNAMGGNAHIVLSAWAKRNGLNITIVPYSGVGKAIPDLLGGHLTAIVDVVGGTMPFVKDGKMIPVTLLSNEPTALAPEARPYTIAGEKDMDVITTFVFFTAAGSPKQDIERLNREIAAVMQIPEVADKIRFLAIEAKAMKVADSETYVRTQHARFGKLVAETGFKSQ